MRVSCATDKRKVAKQQKGSTREKPMLGFGGLKSRRMLLRFEMTCIETVGKVALLNKLKGYRS